MSVPGAWGFLLALGPPADSWQVWPGVHAPECVLVSGPVSRNLSQAPGSAMARARQEGSSPEPVEGLARDGPRPFPLSRLVPSAVSCGLCEPGLPAAPAAPRPAARCLPLRPRRPARRHRRPGGPPLAWGPPQPSPSPAPRRSTALTLAGRAAPGVAGAQRPGGPGGRPHPGSPGSPGGGGAVGPGDRGPAAADGGRPERAVRAAETRGAAATPPLALEGPVQSHHGTPAPTQGPSGPGDGAQLGACTRPGDVGDLGGRTLPPPDALASAGGSFCTM
uniref:BCL2 binding component 3 n=1 Tax=Equus asinus TaxID=9793 RepID=A0A9L0IH22_EQUAS